MTEITTSNFFDPRLPKTVENKRKAKYEKRNRNDPLDEANGSKNRNAYRV